MSEQPTRLPCPFCGHRRVELRVQPRFDLNAEPASEHNCYFMRCTGCDSFGPWSKSATEALRLWNTRPVQP